MRPRYRLITGFIHHLTQKQEFSVLISKTKIPSLGWRVLVELED